MRDLMNDIRPVRVISPVIPTDNTAQVGTPVNHKGYDSATYIIATGTLADAGAEFTTLLEEADDDGAGSPGSYNAVADADLIGTEALASFIQSDDNKCFKLGYRGGKEWTRLTITPTNNASAAPLAAICVLGHPSVKPTANPPA